MTGEPGLWLIDEPGVRNCYADEQPIRDQFWHPGPGEVVIDVGSALGSYSMPALAAGARVIAIEPDREARLRFDTIAEMNGLTDYKQLDFAVFDGSAGYTEQMRADLAASNYYYLAPPDGTLFTTLDNIVATYIAKTPRNTSRVDWIKIDVEGAELGVLQGGMATLREFRPKLLIEDHTGIYPFVDEIDSTSKILALLTGLGYQIQTTTYGPPFRSYIYAEVPQ